MKKLVCTLILASLIFMSLEAQVMGGRIGYGYNSYSFDTLTIQNENGVDTFQMTIDNRGGTIYAGVFYRLDLGFFYLEAEPMLTSFSYDTRLRNDLEWNGGSIVKRERFNTVDVGLTAGIKLWDALRFHGGVTGQVWTNYISEVQDYIPAYSNDWNRLVRSVHGGVGLDIVNVTVDFNYERTLEGIGDNMTFYGQSYAWNATRSRFIIKLGLRISGKKE